MRNLKKFDEWSYKSGELYLLTLFLILYIVVLINLTISEELLLELSPECE